MAERIDANAESAKGSANKPWLSAFLTLVGSSGLISVFGPITGELYWDGYLSAYGLTPEEFPALASRVRVYAYTAIVDGVGTIAIGLLKISWVVFFLAWMSVAVALILQQPSFQAKTEKLRSRLADSLRDGSSASLAMRLGTAALAVAAVAFISAYFVVAVLVLTVLPTRAHALGLERGQAEIKLRSEASPGTIICDHVGPLVTGCPKVIAFSEKSLAVLLEGRMHRIARESSVFITVGATPSGSASAPAKGLEVPPAGPSSPSHTAPG